MSTQSPFDFVKDKDIEGRFDGGKISTDAGLLVIIEWGCATRISWNRMLR